MNTEFPRLGDACDFVHVVGGKMIWIIEFAVYQGELVGGQ
jgi:hypothetical protein